MTQLNNCVEIEGKLHSKYFKIRREAVLQLKRYCFMKEEPLKQSNLYQTVAEKLFKLSISKTACIY